MQVELTPVQITNLAKPFIGMVETLKDFYKNPHNEKAYREWYFKKYGHEPPKDDEVNK